MRNKLLSAFAALVVASTVFADVVDQTNEPSYGKDAKDMKQLIAVQDENQKLLYVYDADNVAKEVFDKKNEALTDAAKQAMAARPDVAAATAKDKKPMMVLEVTSEGDSKGVTTTESWWGRWGGCGHWCRPWGFASVFYYPVYLTYYTVNWAWNWGWNNWGYYGGC
jgi:hypothetical protein